jgi:hypothetical protein
MFGFINTDQYKIQYEHIQTNTDQYWPIRREWIGLYWISIEYVQLVFSQQYKPIPTRLY